MNILVTGGCGYIGSHTVLQLSEAGYQVTVIDDLSNGSADALLHGEELVIGDVGNRELLRSIFAKKKYDALIHFAAFVVVPDSVRDPLSYYQNNTFNTLTLLQEASRAGVKHLVFSSTAAVYGERQSHVRETDPVGPTNPYGRSKWMSEMLIEDLAKASPLRSVILRYFNVAGADLAARIGQRGKGATHLIKVACQVATKQRDSLQITGTDYETEDGTGVRDYIHVVDLAAAHLDALRYLAAGGESQLLNCGYGRGSSVRQVVSALEQEISVPLPVVLAPRRAGDVSCLVAKVERIKKVLGWQPQHDSLQTIVSSALAWEKKLQAADAGENQ